MIPYPIHTTFRTAKLSVQQARSSSFDEEWDDHNDKIDGIAGCAAQDYALPLTPSTTTHRKIRFGFTEVIELYMTKGDHPECTCGPAVCLSPVIGSRRKVTVDTFEEMRQRKVRRTIAELYIAAWKRRRM